jgi:hypothetical protein
VFPGVPREEFAMPYVAALAAFLIFASQAAAATPEQLIDRLTRIDCNGPGLFERSPHPDFWAVVPDLDEKRRQKPKCVPGAMSALVRLGGTALPALVRHIEDQRPTRLKVGSKWQAGELGGQVFSEEYESRAHTYREYAWPSPFLDKCAETSCFTGRGFSKPYTIRVGDVCFTLIGQIVNRYMVAARYQPTGVVVVNSPMEAPSLVRRVRADWTGVGARDLRTSLLADLHMPLNTSPAAYEPPVGFVKTNDRLPHERLQPLSLRDLYAGALRRLRFYYPDTYATLAGDDLAKKRDFEKLEAAVRAAYARAPHSGN